jgi:hypothetical protein
MALRLHLTDVQWKKIRGLIQSERRAGRPGREDRRVDPDRYARGMELLERIVSMLSKMI